MFQIREIPGPAIASQLFFVEPKEFLTPRILKIVVGHGSENREKKNTQKLEI